MTYKAIKAIDRQFENMPNLRLRPFGFNSFKKVQKHFQFIPLDSKWNFRHFWYIFQFMRKITAHTSTGCIFVNNASN